MPSEIAPIKAACIADVALDEERTRTAETRKIKLIALYGTLKFAGITDHGQNHSGEFVAFLFEQQRPDRCCRDPS